MKTIAAIALFAGGVVVQSLIAADMFLVNLRGTCHIRGDLGTTAERRTTASILEHHGASMETPMAGKDLRLVYRPDADRISIVMTNGTVVCDYFIFATPTGFSNSKDTLRERLVFVYSEASSIAIGSGLVSERLAYNAGGELKRYMMTGKLQYTQPGTEETGPEVCNATFKTGKLWVPVATTSPEEPAPPAP
jgi:hypothetical protein